MIRFVDPALDRYGDYASKGPMLALGPNFFKCLVHQAFVPCFY